MKINNYSAIFLFLFNELFVRISVVIIDLILTKNLLKNQKAVGLLNYQIVQSLVLRGNGIQSTSSVIQVSDTVNYKAGDLNRETVRMCKLKGLSCYYLIKN